MLAARNVTKSYGDVVALRGVDLDVDAGSVVSLLGRNGAGKTTLLSAIAGLRRPDGGTITVGDIDLWANPAAAAKLVGIAPQETGIYRAVTVAENLAFFGDLAGLSKKDRNRRVHEVAEQLSLTALLDRKATQLSGGEARRLHTACALVHKPKLLLLDEPTVGADVATRGELIQAVRQLAADGAAVVYTTHYLPEVEALAADIVVIDDGQILARGTQHELIERYRVSGVEVEFNQPVDIDPAIRPDLTQLDPTRWRLGSAESIADATASLVSVDATIVSAEFIRPDLERVFLNITGHGLEDDPDEDDPDDETATSDAAAATKGAEA